MVNFDGVDVARGLAGGLLIGISSTLNLFLYGHLTGLSGYLSVSLMLRIKSGFFWKLTFICGLISSILVAYLIFGGRELTIGSEDIELYDSDSEAPNAFRLLFGGLLVGFGTRLGNGCTSGHGVSGLARFSKRSFVAVGCFFGLALATANILRHTGFFKIDFLEELRESFDREASETVAGIMLGILLIFMICLWIVSFAINGVEQLSSDLSHYFIKYILGIVFGVGLSLSGMTRPSKVRNFLVFDKNWDITLLMVLISAVTFNLVTFQLILRKRKDKPLLTEEYQLPCKDALDWRLISGSLLFGIGWGFCFFCPGPSILACVVSGAGSFCFIFIVIGMYAFEVFDFILEKNNQEEVSEDGTIEITSVKQM
ncbi:uncharacterized protein LOC142353429 [Convolutriloba macropyga]|uniref:uncharacterized protein LOC142353429 n=1 Tax=Convolutriloba macropyga TaxID=536237 RepID=UPI003F5239B0